MPEKTKKIKKVKKVKKLTKKRSSRGEDLMAMHTGKFNSVVNQPKIDSLCNLNNNDISPTYDSNGRIDSTPHQVTSSMQPPSWQEYKTALKHSLSDDSSDLTASSYTSSVSVERRVKRAASLVSQKYLDHVESKVLAMSTIKPIDEKFTKQAQEEINYRQGIRLNIIKEQMKESLIQSNSLKSRFESGGEFTDLVLGFSEKVHRIATDLTWMQVEKHRESKLQAELYSMRLSRASRNNLGTPMRVTINDMLTPPQVASPYSKRKSSAKKKRSSSKKQRSSTKKRCSSSKKRKSSSKKRKSSSLRRS